MKPRSSLTPSCSRIQRRGLAESTPEANAYEFQSGGVVEMFEKFLDKFIEDRTILEKEEVNYKHDLPIQDLNVQIAQAAGDRDEQSEFKAQILQSKAGVDNAAALVQDDKFSALMQQSAMSEKHTKSSSAGGSIIDILEVCEIDFSNGLANEEATEADAVAAYEKISHENKIKRESRNRISSTRQECKSLCLLISPFPTPSCLLQGMFLRVILWGRISLWVYLVHFSE